MVTVWHAGSNSPVNKRRRIRNTKSRSVHLVSRHNELYTGCGLRITESYKECHAKVTCDVCAQDDQGVQTKGC